MARLLIWRQSFVMRERAGREEGERGRGTLFCVGRRFALPRVKRKRDEGFNIRRWWRWYYAPPVYYVGQWTFVRRT